ncbi:MAG TPA: NADH-quinone oxidoreductase subunit C [Nitrosopumilaceae archaeon]|nr:NADH-quinone oxidoreductase subunit C [Nitrosopumilaceae archaeon]
MSSEKIITEKSSETVETKPEVVKKETAPIVEPKFEKSLAEKIVSKFGAEVTIGFIKPNRIRVNTKKENILDVATFIRDELNFDHAESVTGVDYPRSKEIEVVYHLGSYTEPQLAKQILTLATRVPREDVPNPGNDTTRMPSLRDVFYSVEFHERECFEMLGVYFEGHPDNRRLLLPEDWADIPPFRKDFSIKGR